MFDIQRTIAKLNLVRSLRYAKENGWIQEYPTLPKNKDEEYKMVSNLMKRFLRMTFQDCHFREVENHMEIRLDGPYFRKSRELNELFSSHKWARWFSDNHFNLYNECFDALRAFTVGSFYYEKAEYDDHILLTVPLYPSRIPGYEQNGLMTIFKVIHRDWRKFCTIGPLYDQIMKLKAEKEEQDRQLWEEFVKEENKKEKERISRALLRPLLELEASWNPVHRLFARKMRDWCIQNQINPCYALEATYEQFIIPYHTKVRIFAPPGSKQEGWIAIPYFPGGKEPEGYEYKGSDIVTQFNKISCAPIVAIKVHAEFHLEYWGHLLPDRYHEIYEATCRFRKQAEEEIKNYSEEELQSLFSDLARVEVPEIQSRLQELIHAQIRRHLLQRSGGSLRRELIHYGILSEEE